METLQIQMLGGFIIRTSNAQISDRDNRSRKVWTLLAYLIIHRNRVVSQEELIRLLWGDGEESSNPSGALKTMFYRVRSTLDLLWPTAGHDLILRKSGGYTWNKNHPISLDIDAFEELCRSRTEDPERRAALAYEALQIYKGDFLPNMSVDAWAIPIAVYYHNLYIRALLGLLPTLQEQNRYAEIAELCRVAAQVEPFHEDIHQYLIKALLAEGNLKSAAAVYEAFSERLYAEFGVMPSEDTRALYYKAVEETNGSAVTMDMIQEQLQEKDSEDGALVCGYDFFRVLCRSMARSMARSGMAAHIGLLSVTGGKDGEMSQRKLKGTMKQLEEQIRLSLRRGDAVAQCSPSQFVIMLPMANNENSFMVCERITKGFYRKHPHSGAIIQCHVSPVKPDEKEVAKWNKEKTFV